MSNNSCVRKECEKKFAQIQKTELPTKIRTSKNHQQHSLQKWIKFTYIILHHIRAMFSHHLHVILYEHSILLLSTFQHGVDSNVRTSSTNTSTVMEQTNKRSQSKNDHVIKIKKKFSRPAILSSSTVHTRWMLSKNYICSTQFLSHWGKRRFSHLKNYSPYHL